MHRVDRVLLALEPVARHFRKHDLDEAVLPGERLPVRHQRRRKRAEIGPDQPGSSLHRIGLDVDVANFMLASGCADVLERLRQAVAALVEPPAVIVAAQAALLDDAVGEIGATMRAMPVEQAERAGEVLVQDQVFAQQPHRLDAVGLVEFAGAGDRHPVAAHQLAHRRARPSLGQELVLLGRQHRDSPNRVAPAHRWAGQLFAPLPIARTPRRLQGRRAYVPTRELCRPRKRRPRPQDTIIVMAGLDPAIQGKRRALQKWP